MSATTTTTTATTIIIIIITINTITIIITITIHHHLGGLALPMGPPPGNQSATLSVAETGRLGLPS